MYFEHEIEATRVKSLTSQLIMPNNNHCSVPLCPNDRSKGQLGITFRRFPVDKYTKKSCIVRIHGDIHLSDRVLRLQDKQALVYKFSIHISFDRLGLFLEPSCYFTTLFIYSLLPVLIKRYNCPLDFEKHNGLLGTF